MPAGLALHLLDAATAAAVACHRWVGAGDKHAADAAAVEAMRTSLRAAPGRGVVVIGEGEKDEAPMLYEGEEVGTGTGGGFDLAVDPLEGTNLCASGAPGAITVLAAAGRHQLEPSPGFYMDKLVVGPAARGLVDLDAPIAWNLARVAEATGRDVAALRVAVLARPRNRELIDGARAAGAGVVEITDGDVMAAVAALVPGSGIDLAAGIGGAPEGVATACAVLALGGDMQARLCPQGAEERARVADAGALGRRYELGDLVRGPDAVFVAAGVTGSALLPGVRAVEDGHEVSSLVATTGRGLLRVTGTVPRPGPAPRA